MKRAAVAWLTVPGQPGPYPVWCLWLDGALYVVSGPGEQPAPGLAGAEVREIRVGLRPASPDSLPLLGAAPAVRNLYLAAGHGPTGLQLGPYSGKLAADLMLRRAIEADISALDVTRFSV